MHPALRVAQQFTRRGNVEVWQLDRKIGLLLAQATPPVAA